jgi:hypothetical protein
MSTASRGLMHAADKPPTTAGPLAESGGLTSASNAHEASPGLSATPVPATAPDIRGLGRPPF